MVGLALERRDLRADRADVDDRAVYGGEASEGLQVGLHLRQIPVVGHPALVGEDQRLVGGPGTVKLESSSGAVLGATPRHGPEFSATLTEKSAPGW